MPDMDGYEVCERLKENNKTKDIPVIFITAKTDESSIERAYDIGGIDYITKPFKPRELLVRVKRELDLQELQLIAIEQKKMGALEELIKNIAHQWRQPLSVISTSASGIELKKELGMLSDKELFGACNTIVNHTKYLSSTIDEFSNMIGKRDDKSEYNLQDTILNSIELFNGLLDDKLNIVVDCSKTISIVGYKKQLKGIVSKLLSNSYDAFLLNQVENRYLSINVSVEQDNIVIRVRDNAGGIAEDILPKIFEPYFTTKHQSQGAGLGLHMAYNVIKNNMHGSIKAINTNFIYEEKEYNGAEFIILIPNMV